MTDETDYLPVAIRAYVPPGQTAFSAVRKPASGEAVIRRHNVRSEHPSDWALIIDVVATDDAAHRLQLGAYQLRKAGRLVTRGFFYDTLTKTDRNAIAAIAQELDAQCMPRDRFASKILLNYGYDLQAGIIGANLPGALARIAAKISPAKGSMKGGVSLTIDDPKYDPRIRIRSIGGSRAFINFSVPNKKSRRANVPFHPGTFIDVLSIADVLGEPGPVLKTRSIPDSGTVEHARQ
jgi:hypothetical protein